jgi:hypothetical protein
MSPDTHRWLPMRGCGYCFARWRERTGSQKRRLRHADTNAAASVAPRSGANPSSRSSPDHRDRARRTGPATAAGRRLRPARACPRRAPARRGIQRARRRPPPPLRPDSSTPARGSAGAHVVACPSTSDRCSVVVDTTKSLTCRAGFGWLGSGALDPGSASSRSRQCQEGLWLPANPRQRSVFDGAASRSFAGVNADAQPLVGTNAGR